MDEKMAISSEQSPHLPSPRLFQRKEIPLPFPTTHITYIAKLSELQQSLICASARDSRAACSGRGPGSWGGDTAGSTLTSLASTPHRQPKQNSGSDQDQPWVLTTRNSIVKRWGFKIFIYFHLVQQRQWKRHSAHFKGVCYCNIFNTPG